MKGSLIIHFMNLNSVRARECTIAAIKRTVAYFFGMTLEELHRKDTTRAATVPRQIAIYLVKQMTDASLSEIGREFGGQHHSTVTRSIRKIEEQRRTKDGLDLTIRVLVESIKDIEDQDISDDRARA